MKRFKYIIFFILIKLTVFNHLFYLIPIEEESSEEYVNIEIDN